MGAVMADGTPVDNKEQKRLIRMAETISKALPYMRRYNDAVVVVKYGGHAMTDPHLGDLFARDVVLMKQVGMFPIVVHGGGPQINRMLKRVGIESTFVHGLRVTDAATIEIVEMVLSGAINKAIVADINECGGTAVGISGKDGNLILARRVTEMPDPITGKILKVDLGQVGEPARINVRVLEQLTAADTIPVVAPVGFGLDDELTYNINADTSAGAIAGAMRAKRLYFLTDVPGVLDKQGKLIEEMTVEQARALIADGTISGGMIPKVENCIDAISAGVEAAVILDGRVPHALLLEIFTESGVGTMVKRK
jgi:acetylglutamate kinase